MVEDRGSGAVQLRCDGLKRQWHVAVAVAVAVEPRHWQGAPGAGPVEAWRLTEEGRHQAP